MKFQQTIAAPIDIAGTALQSGATVKMSIKPQPEDTGIYFKRIDLPEQPIIKAEVNAVIDTTKSMTIGKDGWKIATIEHLMATFHGLGIDNALIEIDGEEVPRGDGSGLYFAEQILKAGIVPQKAPRKYLRIQDPVWVEGIVYKQNEPTKASLVILPDEDLEISFTFTSDHHVTGTQYYHYKLDTDTFLRDIAPARTIAFRREIEYLQSKGLALGGDLNTVVVVGDRGYENELRFPEEIVRHKILDILGDLYLLGPLTGHIIAIRSGHALDYQLAKKIISKNATILL